MLKAGLPGPHRRVLVTIALAVVVAHALLLGGVGEAWQPPREAVAAAVQVREIAAPAPEPAAVVPEPAEAAVASPPPAPSPVRPRRTARAPAPVAVAATATATATATPQAADPPPAEVVAAGHGDSASQEADMPLIPVATASAAVVLAEAAVPPAHGTLAPSAPSAPSADPPPPTYATRLPPSATVRYHLQRGMIGGAGELRWQLDGGRYELRLDGAVVGVSVLVQVSRGTIDAAGIAPQRFTDQRARRSARAANFQREAHKVSFSGNSAEVTLSDGAQDRLSWMVQLPAIVAADPARGAPGAKTALQVVGARGDSSVWVFRCLGAASVETRAGVVPALHFVREPRGPHDTGVAVWLDPARHHLPLRATMRNGDEGEVLELKLKDMSFPG